MRYRQSVLGGLWAFLQPLAMMVVFTIVFSRLVRVPTGDIPYAPFAYAGILPADVRVRERPAQRTNPAAIDDHVVVGVGDDLRARGLRAARAGDVEARPGLEHVANGAVACHHIGCGARRRRVVHDEDFVRRRIERDERVEAPREAIRAIARACDDAHRASRRGRRRGFRCDRSKRGDVDAVFGEPAGEPSDEEVAGERPSELIERGAPKRHAGASSVHDRLVDDANRGSGDADEGLDRRVPVQPDEIRCELGQVDCRDAAGPERPFARNARVGHAARRSERRANAPTAAWTRAPADRSASTGTSCGSVRADRRGATVRRFARGRGSTEDSGRAPPARCAS